MSKHQTGSPAPAKPRRHTFTYWVTRDADPETGVIDNFVRVWLAPPQRHSVGQGAIWSTLTREIDLYGRWSLPDCWYHCKTTPDDDRQCLRVEGDSIRNPAQPVERPS